MEMLERDQPLLLLASPMCGAFSAMNNINYSKMKPKDIHTKLRAAMQHVRFALELCVRQYDAGRLFIFEHPATATSWSTEMMQQVLSMQGVLTAKFDFCTLGMKTTDRRGEPVAAKKRTTVMTNSSNIGEMLRRAQCDGSHLHGQLIGGKAKACEVYPDPFVELICEGILKEL